MNYEPLKVTIKLLTGYAQGDQPFHLDALLGALRLQLVTQSVYNVREYHHDLPLQKHVVGDKWVFKASLLQPQNVIARELQMQTGRMSVEAAAQSRASGFLHYRPNKPNPSGGYFKGSLYHVPLTHAASLVAYCVGDLNGVRQLLELCHQVGARRGVGYGKVESVQVEPVALEQCDWQNRHMPYNGEPEPGYSLAVGSLVSPYWDRSQFEPLLVPNRAA